jgi:teichoic acid transport system ATP-binding protein
MERVRATNLGITFRLVKRKRTKLQNIIGGFVANMGGKCEEFWALRHVNLTVHDGDTVGIIGRNGSGKSTLLRVIAGIYPPDEGRVVVNGDVSTLFSLGLGFKPNLTGFDNIYLSGVVMGLSRKEIDRVAENIVEFSELGQFIHQPVRTYSTGMQSRLGFAIAMNVSKDILLMDEVVGAGDAEFRKKCEDALRSLMGSRTVILVSHSMTTIRNTANKVIWLKDGQVAAEGKPNDVIQQYTDHFGKSRKARAADEAGQVRMS